MDQQALIVQWKRAKAYSQMMETEGFQMMKYEAQEAAQAAFLALTRQDLGADTERMKLQELRSVDQFLRRTEREASTLDRLTAQLEAMEIAHP